MKAEEKVSPVLGSRSKKVKVKVKVTRAHAHLVEWIWALLSATHALPESRLYKA